MKRVIIDTPFYQKRIISYGLIVYAIKTHCCIIVQRKHSVEFLIVMSGQYRPSYLFFLLKWHTQEELDVLKNLINQPFDVFKKTILMIGLDDIDVDYSYQRFCDAIPLLQNYFNTFTNDCSLSWTWPKGRLNLDHETIYMCALREFEEEVEIKLPPAKYISPTYFNLDTIKTINNKMIETRCWLYVIEDEVELPLITNHKEVNQRCWVDFDTALQLTHSLSIKMLLFDSIKEFC
jgi:8-oxo-dGTP pyrophosphatase MutT (NUDIX family)